MKKIILCIAIAGILSGCGAGESIDTNEAAEKYVLTGPGTQLEMLDKEYWLNLNSKDADEIILDIDEIKQINEKNTKMLVSTSGIEKSLWEIEEHLETKFALEMMDVYDIPKDAEVWYVDGELVTEDYWAKLLENCDRERVEKMESVSCRFGFCVDRGDVKGLPTDDFFAEAIDDYHYDLNARAECPAYAPVVVLHESKDGEWYYVVCDSYAGWIKREYIALCDSRQEWMERQNPEEFLVVTGRELRLVSDPYQPESSEKLLAMGTVLPLVSLEEAPEDFHGRKSYGNYIVKVPVRLENGTVGDSYVLIPVSEDVREGYVPYTRANLLDLLFKRQGDRYGWAGMYYSNDCSGIMKEIYGCFGFDFPRNARGQIGLNSMEYVNVEEMSDKEKIEILKELPAGTLLYFPGHIMAYLGMVDDVPYVISSVGSWAEEDSEVMSVNTVAVNSMTDTVRRNGKTWLESVTEILVCE